MTEDYGDLRDDPVSDLPPQPGCPVRSDAVDACGDQLPAGSTSSTVQE